jgi:predicted nucleic acid-binding protein
VEQPASSAARTLAQDDPHMAAWWASPVECWSAMARLRRENRVDLNGEDSARARLKTLQESWLEIRPSEEIRMLAARLLRLHPLRAHDALQLAAALAWAGSPPSGEIAAFDHVLREAARLEGLTPRP